MDILAAAAAEIFVMTIAVAIFGGTALLVMLDSKGDHQALESKSLN